MRHDFKFEVISLTEAVDQTLFPHGNVKPIVMVVDDEPLIVDSLAAIFSNHGMTVLKAYDASSALELAMACPPDLLVTDVAMPGMNGIDLAMAVAEALPICKVLLFSAHASTLDLSRARLAGFDFPLLAKPIHPRELLRHVSGFLHGQPLSKAHRVFTENSHAALWRLPQLNG